MCTSLKSFFRGLVSRGAGQKVSGKAAYVQDADRTLPDNPLSFHAKARLKEDTGLGGAGAWCSRILVSPSLSGCPLVLLGTPLYQPDPQNRETQFYFRK